MLVDNQFVSGVVGKKDGKLYICFAPNQSVYQLFRLSFNDEHNIGDGKWLLNLWFSKVCLTSDTPAFEKYSKGEVEDFCDDHFLLLRLSSQTPEFPDELSDLATVICKSWKVRMDDGSLRLPMLREEFSRT